MSSQLKNEYTLFYYHKFPFVRYKCCLFDVHVSIFKNLKNSKINLLFLKGEEARQTFMQHLTGAHLCIKTVAVPDHYYLYNFKIDPFSAQVCNSVHLFHLWMKRHTSSYMYTLHAVNLLHMQEALSLGLLREILLTSTHGYQGTLLWGKKASDYKNHLSLKGIR